MANKSSGEQNTSLWLHNKLGTSNDSWTSGSICSQLNKDVLRNIKDCFPDLQTQVKLKLLLSFFHIPRRLIEAEEWKSELEEIIDTAGIDSELWVSMLAETMKTLPASGSLNTEISDYEENRPIFTDMVNDLRKMVTKHSDIGMLPLECQYLNKAALTSVVGQQPAPEKHFTLKRKPKSTALRAELLLKSSDAQSSLKKVSAPTIPLRSRGMPRKMTDTTPLKGIPSRVPTSGFLSQPTLSQNRPNFSRIPAGRKEGGVKLLDITEQPLGYAQAKKRKRQQELEEQQKKALENQNNNNSPTSTATTPANASNATPDYAAGLTATSVYTQPPTPAATLPNVTVKSERTNSPPPLTTVASSSTIANQQNALSASSDVKMSPPNSPVPPPTPTVRTVVATTIPTPGTNSIQIKQEPVTIKQEPITIPTIVPAANNNLAKITSNVLLTTSSMIPTMSTSQSSITTMTTPSTMAEKKKIYITHSNAQPPQLITTLSSSLPTSIIKQQSVQSGGTPITIITSSASNTTGSLGNNIIQIPRQTTIKQIQRPIVQQQQQQLHQQQTTAQITQIQQPNPNQPQILSNQQIRPQQKIIYKTVVSSANTGNMSTQNIPPLIPTHSMGGGNKIQVQNVQNINIPLNRIQLDNKTNIIRIAAPQQQGQPTTIHQIPMVSGSTTMPSSSSMTLQSQAYGQQQQAQQQKTVQQIVLQSPGGMNMKGKTIILANPNQLTQKSGGVIIRQGNNVYQQISGLNFINSGPPGLIKTEPTQQIQQQQHQQQHKQQIPALVPASSMQNIPSLSPVVIQQQGGVQTLLTNQNQKTTIVRPVQMANMQGMNVLPQGLTLIQRPGQQPQLVQLSSNQTIQGGQQTIQRAIITQQSQQQGGERSQLRQQTIYVPQQTQIQQTQIQQPQQQQQQQQQPQPGGQIQQQNNRKGLMLPPKCYAEAHEMFRNANVVTRPDKALILGFMAGYRQNPRPSKENVLVIKLGDTKEQILQENGSYVLTSVESFVKLDFNTGEWKTFKETKILEHHHEDGNSANNSVAIN